MVPAIALVLVLLPAPGALGQATPVPAGYVIQEPPTLGGDAGTPVSLAGMPAAITRESEVGGDVAVSDQFVIESHDISFVPAEIEVPANTEVTILLPNLGAAPHNFSIDALGISVDIAPGETADVAFNGPPGEYEYYCNVPGHREAGMVGTLVVRAGIAATPPPSPTPAPLTTPVATPVAVLPCREVMENDFPNQRRELLADCATDRTIFVAEMWVFDGGGHTIYARDPAGGRLTGGVVTVSGNGSTVRNVTVDGSRLTAPCLVDYGATSLAGVLVQGTGGQVTGVTVRNLNRTLPREAGGASGGSIMESCGEGITVEGAGVQTYVTENVIENTGLAGILINEGTASISYNTIDRVTDVGILAMNGAKVRVSPGNRISNGGTGIQLEDSGTGGRIAGNRVASMSRGGIAVILGAHAAVADNTVEDAFYGVAVQGVAAADITANTIRRAADSGIFVTHPGTEAAIEENTIEASVLDGVWVQEGAQASVVRNTVAGAARHGIVAVGVGTQVTIDGNVVTDAAEDGILASAGAEAGIAQNRVAEGQRGIEVAGVGTTATVTNNAVERVGVVGITINQGATASGVFGNAVRDARFGIVTLGAGTTSTIADNTVSDLSGTGFTVESGAAAELRGNYVSDARLGVFVTSAGTTTNLTENRIERMNTGGIIVEDGARAAVAGNTLLQPGTNGIEIDGAEHVRLEGNTIEDARDDGIRFQRVRTASATGSSVELVSHDIYYEPNEITIPAGTDVTLTLPNEGAAPHNVTIDALGIDVDIAPGATEEVVINAPAGTYEIHCSVPGHREAGQVAELLVAPGIRSGAGAEPAEADVIRDNEISGGENGIVLTGEGAMVAVEENSVAGSSGAGIAIANGAEASVANNAITEARIGITLASPGTTASLVDNRVEDLAERGIYVHSGAEATVRQNMVTRAGTSGIVVNGRGTTAMLTGNLVNDAAESGISVEAAASATITDGNLVIGGKWGINVLSDGTTAEVRGNRVSNVSNQGIAVIYGARATLAENSVNGGNSGIYVRSPGSRAVITGNSVTAEERGIYVWEDATAERIADNFVAGVASGIVIEGEGVRAVVEDNHVQSIAREGIVVRDGATAIVTGNRVQRNSRSGGARGIVVTGPGSAATVTDNEVSDIDGIGIQVGLGATGTVHDNRLRAIASTGIRVMGAPRGVLVSENTLREAGTIGIEGRLSEVAIRDNTVEGSSFAGIQLGVGIDADVTGNTISGPAEPDADDPGPYGIHIQRDASGVVGGNRVSGVVNEVSGTACAIRVDANASDIRVADNLFPPPVNDQDVCDEWGSVVAATPVPADATPAATPMPDDPVVRSSTDRDGV